MYNIGLTLHSNCFDIKNFFFVAMCMYELHIFLLSFQTSLTDTLYNERYMSSINYRQKL